MLTTLENAAFLSCELKNFGKGENRVEYGEAKFLSSDNEVVKATLNKDFCAELIQEGLPERLTPVTVELDVTEEIGKNGSYLKKKLISIS